MHASDDPGQSRPAAEDAAKARRPVERSVDAGAASSRAPKAAERRERVLEEGLESFPASDPPSWWAGA